VLRGWIGAERWPLTHLRATGRFERVDPALVQRALLPYAKHGYFAVDLQAAQGAIAQLPWVDRAQVRKRWPDVLEVSITEHRPFARWGRDRLLSDRGRLFAARGAKVPAGLPLFDGPEAQAAQVVELYQQSRTLFMPVGMNVDAVMVDPRGSWSLTLLDRAHGSPTQVIVGRSEARARIGRFVRLLPQLTANPERRIERADLRYTNGFALVWAKAAATDAAANDAATPAKPLPTQAALHAIRGTGLGVRIAADLPHLRAAATRARRVINPFPIPGLS